MDPAPNPTPAPTTTPSTTSSPSYGPEYSATPVSGLRPIPTNPAWLPHPRPSLPTANAYRALQPQEAWNEMGNMEAYFRQMSQVARPGHQLHHLNPTCGQPNQIPDNRPINRLLLPTAYHYLHHLLMTVAMPDNPVSFFQSDFHSRSLSLNEVPPCSGSYIAGPWRASIIMLMDQ